MPGTIGGTIRSLFAPDRREGTSQQVLLPYRALGGVTLQVFRQYVEPLVDPPAQMLPCEHPAAPAEEERQHPAHHQNP